MFLGALAYATDNNYQKISGHVLRTFNEIDASVAAPDKGSVHIARRPGKTNAYQFSSQTISFRTQRCVHHAPVLIALLKKRVIRMQAIYERLMYKCDDYLGPVCPPQINLPLLLMGD